ncbi:MAG: class I SAM-dependent methyltransferase [Thermoanaerobaculia bacterium]
MNAMKSVRQLIPVWLRRKARGAQRRAMSLVDPEWIGEQTEESLGQQLLTLDCGLGLFRLVHLLDALSTVDGIKSIVSVGSGGGHHEAYLALKHPELQVTGVDLRVPDVQLKLPNLRFLQGNLLDPAFTATIPQADFVYSIECFEHIEEDRLVFATAAALVRPGGFLYVEVPFASAAEQADPELCRRERESFEHVRPGYSARQLEDLARSNGLSVRKVAGAFWFPIQPSVWSAYMQFGAAALAPHWRAYFEFARFDLRQGIPANRTEATAIKILAARGR